MLDISLAICHTCVRMDTFSTRQVAKMLGIQPKTLSRYIAAGKVPAPKTVQLGGLRVHAWSKRDVEHLRELLPRIKNGRKTRYQTQKKQTKKTNHQRKKER